MYNIFHRYEISKKTSQYNSTLKKITKVDFSHLSLDQLKEKLNEKPNLTESEDDIIFLFSIIKEVINKTYNIKVHDEQILGGISLYNKNIIDMKTGEGKTIVALFPSIINAKLGKTIHIVTANDYLAERDYKSSKQIFDFFNINVNYISEQDERDVRREKYKNSVIYTNAKTLCFDYLSDNLVRNKSKKIQSTLDVAIIDEIDFVLIEEARSPIAISGKTDETLHSAVLFQDNIFHFELNKEFDIDEKTKNVELRDSGFKKLESLLINNSLIESNSSLYTHENTKYLQTFTQTLRANYTLKIDIDYIVKDNKIVIIDENTGRLTEGKTWSGGLHQAVEIKENVPVNQDSKTLASSSLQGFFLKYNFFVGMSGTAINDDIEFKEIYNLDVIEIPTHQKVLRNDFEDVLYHNTTCVIDEIIKDVKTKNDLGRPVLIGTTNVKDSETIYSILQSNNIRCEILNAKNHEREASIIENAGKSSHVTISTNMAGRGTDIMLGGNKDTEIENFLSQGLTYKEAYDKWKLENKRINELGGLHIIGFSRSTSRKIDNQLKGRAGRQGDKGSSKFYLSLEDELLSVYGRSLELLWNTLTMGVKTVGVSDKRMSKQIIEAQKRNENFLFNARKTLVKYSEIIEKQADIIVDMRNNILNQTNFKNFMERTFNKALDYIMSDINELSEDIVSTFKNEVHEYFQIEMNILNQFDFNNLQITKKEIVDYLMTNYLTKRSLFEDNVLFEKDLVLNVIDNAWTEHLTALDNMKKGTSFRVFAQKNPFDEFKNEAFKMFNFLVRQIFLDISSIMIEFNPVDFIQKISDNRADISPSKNIEYKNVFLNTNKYGF